MLCRIVPNQPFEGGAPSSGQLVGVATLEFCVSLSLGDESSKCFAVLRLQGTAVVAVVCVSGEFGTKASKKRPSGDGTGEEYATKYRSRGTKIFRHARTSRRVRSTMTDCAPLSKNTITIATQKIRLRAKQSNRNTGLIATTSTAATRGTP